MRKIAVLDQNTIDKIAAGEVVERPSSVVKELVENAIDAGATAVTVEITDGGKKLIRITDNGSGMEAEQIPLAFLRHATSKIEKVEDLEHIASLGFRGEALSSIAAVSQVELITKTPSSVSGSRYVIEGGQDVERKDAVELEEDEYFIADMIGIEVVTEDDKPFGTLKDVMETGANDVYVIDTDEHGEVLVPAIRECILDVDIENQKMKIHLMDGLI